MFTAGPAVTAQAGFEVAHVFTSRGDGTFAGPELWTTPLPASALTEYEHVPERPVASGVQAGEVVAAPDQLLTGDFDGDGQTDLAVLATTPTEPATPRCSGC